MSGWDIGCAVVAVVGIGLALVPIIREDIAFFRYIKHANDNPPRCPCCNRPMLVRTVGLGMLGLDMCDCRPECRRCLRCKRHCQCVADLLATVGPR